MNAPANSVQIVSKVDTITEGDTHNFFDVKLLDSTGDAIDLSSATVTWSMANQKGRVITNKTAFKQTEIGVLRLAIDSLDETGYGRMEVEITVDYGGDIEKFPAGGKLRINIGKSIDNLTHTPVPYATITYFTTQAENAVNTANQAKTQSDSTQAQLDQIVVDGDSSVEAAQARVDANGVVYDTLKDRADNDFITLNQQKADLEKITKQFNVARDIEGIRKDGAVASFIGNKGLDPIVQIANFQTPSHASKYDNRDAASIYTSMEGNNPVVVTENVTYTATTVQFSDEVDFSKIKPGMMLDTLHTPNRYTSWIVSIDEANKTITVQDGWYELIPGTGSTTPSTPPDGVGCQINLITAVWGINNNVFLRSGSKTNVAVAEEIGLFNQKGGQMEGINIVNFEQKSDHAFKARTPSGRESFGFVYGYVAESCDIGFVNRSSQSGNVLIRSTLNGSKKDGYEIKNNGSQNKLRLNSAIADDGVLSINDVESSVIIFNKTVLETTSIYSPVGRSGEVKFLQNIGTETANITISDGSSFETNRIVSSSFNLLPKSQCHLVSYANKWYVLGLSSRKPVFNPNNRPSGLSAEDIGTTVFDSNLNKDITWNGSQWVDAMGNTV